MLERIAFELANNRTKYTHFIDYGGGIACLCELEQLCSARVGVMCDIDFPTEDQYRSSASSLASHWASTLTSSSPSTRTALRLTQSHRARRRWRTCADAEQLGVLAARCSSGRTQTPTHPSQTGPPFTGGSFFESASFSL